MIKNYKNIKIFMLLLVVAGIQMMAQTRITNGTKVIVVVNKQSNAIKSIELFDAANAEENILEKHPESIFVLGLFKGSYQLDDKTVKPEKGGEITVFTDKQLFAKAGFDSDKKLITSKINAKLISKKKGEVILKVE